MVPPDMHAPSGGEWLIGRGGYLVTPIPAGDQRQVDIYDHFWHGLNGEQRADPAWDPDNVQAWDAFFMERRQREIEYYDGVVPPPLYNMEGRRRWCGAAKAEHSPPSSTTSARATSLGSKCLRRSRLVS